MKNEDKKSSCAPKRLWVRTNSLILDSGLVSVGNVSYKESHYRGRRHKMKKIKLYSSILCSMTDLYAH